ncbi:MAG: hypothetical protein PHT69_06380 [Bacteroidales bacterium]|nr:hypothetical protein [Bacteroidales bacterium]
MLLSFFENIELHNFINLFIASVLFYIVAFREINEDKVSKTYNKAILFILCIIVLEGIIINILYYTKGSYLSEYGFAILFINNLYILIALLSIWIYYYRRLYGKRRNFIIYSIIGLCILFIVIILILITSGVHFGNSDSTEYATIFNFLDLKIKILLTLILIFTLLSVSFFSIILLSRLVRGYVNKRNNEHKKYLFEQLSQYIYAEKETRELIKSDIELFLKGGKGRKQLTVDVIINLKKNISGDLSKNITDLYYALKLDDFSMRKINSRKWFIRAKGIREISDMDIADFGNNIRDFLDSKNDILRGEAIFAVSNLFGSKNPVCFLSDYKQKLNLWEQINIIFNSIKKRQLISNLDNIIKSKNESVKVFALRLVKINKLSNYYPNVIDFIRYSPSDLVRSESYKAFAALNISDDIEILFEKYFMETYSNKIEILKVLVQIPENASLSFLKSILLNENDYKIRLLICKGIEALGSPMNVYLRNLMQEKSSLRPYILHAIDKRL